MAWGEGSGGLLSSARAQLTHETRVHSSLNASTARFRAQWFTTSTYCMAISSQGLSRLPS